MNKTILLYSFLILLILPLCGCSINIPQGATPTAILPAIITPPPASPNTASSQGSNVGNPSLPSTTIPVTWSGLNMTGKLVYMTSIQSGSSDTTSIQALDLVSGAITTIFQAPATAWIDYVSVSPDRSQLVMAYLPPRTSETAGRPSQQALYTLPLDGSGSPELLFQPPSGNEQYFQPTWSPDGKYLYFAQVDYGAPPRVTGQHYGYFELCRIAYPGGQLEKLVDEAYWPRLSRDGARLAYVTLDPVDGSNKLFVANPDGTGAYQVNLSGQYVPQVIDAPMFTPDEQNILYSAVTPTQASQPNWIERLLGVTVASAHTVLSDWWSVPIGGGTPTQLTHIAAVGLVASPAPDGKYIASYSGNGLFVMNPDGTRLTMLIADMGGQPGTVSWLP